MIKRLEILLNEYNLTASRLSERIGVQRSGISHILAGRNKPSFDFLLKLAKEFPEININWLLTGKGEMLVDKINKEPDLFNPSTRQINISKAAEIQDSKTIYDNENDVENKEDNLENNTEVNVYNRKQISGGVDNIEQIVIFYKEGKFRRYLGE